MGEADVREVVEAQRTPFQTRVEADELFALFRKLDGEAAMEVQLVAPGSSAKATGEVGVVMRRGEKVMGTML